MAEDRSSRIPWGGRRKSEGYVRAGNEFGKIRIYSINIAYNICIQPLIQVSSWSEVSKGGG